MVRFMTDKMILMGSLTAFGVMAWCWGGEDSHREAEKLLDLMDREEMETLHPAVYDGANYVAGQTEEHAQLDEASKKDLSEELDGAEEGIQLFDDFIARKHQETETTNDLQRICEEVHGAEADNDLHGEEADNDLQRICEEVHGAETDNDLQRICEEVHGAEADNDLQRICEEVHGAEADNDLQRICEEVHGAEADNDLQRICEEVHGAEAEENELSTDNAAISALNADLERADKKIKDLMARLEIAESQNDELREELSSKTFVQVSEIEVCNNIGNLALMDDLHRANNNIESLFLSLEKAEARNDQIRDELLAKTYVETELENAREEIRILEKKLERVTRDLETANEQLMEKSDLEEYVESADKEIGTLLAELDSVKAENKRLKTKNVCEKAALESELNAAVEEVYRIGTKLDAVLDENTILKTELLIKKDVVCDLEMAEEELDKLWKEIAGVKEENRRLKRDLSEERATNNALMEADEKNKILEEEIRNLTSVADEFAIYKEKYQHMMERNVNLDMELNIKNYAITQLVEGLSQIHPELKELYNKEISGEQTGDLIWDSQLNRFALQETRRQGRKKNLKRN
ncbi:myosin heavy chain, clone 203-like [Palaemon carinicauda]|uniref:myosin heavy chain, clone 203-like n=1 Tax=Palaemon carinicauda TaxID=392227 RepID=UPI0035B5C365